MRIFFFLTFGVLVLLFSFPSDSWARRSYYRYTRYWRYKKRWLHLRRLLNRKLPRQFTRKRRLSPRYFKLIRLSSNRKIDKKKVIYFINRRLRRVFRCFDLLLRRSSSSRKETFEPPPIPKKLQLSMKINSFGRAIHTEVLTKNVHQAVSDCFLWYLRGRKYFPPQGKKTALLKMTFAFKRRGFPRKKRKKSRRSRKNLVR